MNHRTIWASCLSCTLAVTIAAGPVQNPNPSREQTPAQQAPGRDPAPGQQDRATAPSSSNESFLNKAIEINAAEVQLGNLAASKGQNQRVKEYANMLVKDHSQALEKLHQAQSGGGYRTKYDKYRADRSQHTGDQQGAKWYYHRAGWRDHHTEWHDHWTSRNQHVAEWSRHTRKQQRTERNNHCAICNDYGATQYQHGTRSRR